MALPILVRPVNQVSPSMMTTQAATVTMAAMVIFSSLLLGVIEIFASAYISTQMSNAIVFAVLIVVLLVRPSGLLGKQVREKV